MAFAAIALFKATQNNNYLTDAINFRNNPDFFVDDWVVLSDENVNQLVNLALYLETLNTEYLTTYENHLQEMYDMQTNCGYMHFANWGSLTYAVNEAYLSLLYYQISGSYSALNFGKTNIDFVLGTHENTDYTIPDNFSFLIGYNELGGGFPQYPHHAGAFGYGADAWDLFDIEQQNPGTVAYNYELSGALVGGPKSECGNYNDNIGDYVSNEVCIYYNVGLINALALVNMVTSVEQYPSQNSLKIFPVPCQNDIFIENPKSSTIYVYDVSGRKILERKIDISKTIDVSELPKGLYILKSADLIGKIIKL
jgi:hypothetical protein